MDDSKQAQLYKNNKSKDQANWILHGHKPQQ